MNSLLCPLRPRRLVVNFLPKWSSPNCVNTWFWSLGPYIECLGFCVSQVLVADVASWSIVVVSCYALGVSSPAWSTVVVVNYALVVLCSTVVVSCYALEVSSPTWSTVVVVNYTLVVLGSTCSTMVICCYALVVFSSVWSTVVAVNYALVVYSSTLAPCFTGFLCFQLLKSSWSSLTNFSFNDAPNVLYRWKIWTARPIQHPDSSTTKPCCCNSCSMWFPFKGTPLRQRRYGESFAWLVLKHMWNQSKV